MQVITSVIKSFGSDSGKTSRYNGIEWDKVNKCRKYLQRSAYEKFQSAELVSSEKRRLLKDHLITLDQERIDELLKYLPDILPEQHLRSTLFLDTKFILTQEQIHHLRLSEEASLRLLKRLIKEGDIETNRRIICDRDWRHYTERGIQTIFKTVAIMDQTAQLISVVFRTICGESFPKHLQFGCARACFKKYDPEQGLEVIKCLQLTNEVIAAYPQLNGFDPSILERKGYLSAQKQRIFQLWIEHADEQTLFLAKGRREAWGVSLEQMTTMLNDAHKLLPRQLVKSTYRGFGPRNQMKLAEKGFLPKCVRSLDAHIQLCELVLKNASLLQISAFQSFLLPFMCRAAEFDRHIRHHFVELVKNIYPFPCAKQELYQMLYANRKEMTSDSRSKSFISLLRNFEDTPQLFALINQLAKDPECHLFIFEHISELRLNGESRCLVALQIVKHAPPKHLKALLEVLSSFSLTSEAMVQVIFKCLSRFPYLAVFPLIHLETYHLNAQARHDFFLRWNERYLEIFIDSLLGKYFDRLSLSTHELERLFMDALSRLDLSELEIDSLFFRRLKELNFASNVRKELFRCALQNSSFSDECEVLVEALKLKPQEVEDMKNSVS